MDTSGELIRFLPFIMTQAIYWTTFLPASEPCLLALIIKCLPVGALVFYVLLHPELPNTGKSLSPAYKIMLGLLFGNLGDGFLVYEEFFVHGMVAFGIGHLFYISAFKESSRHPLSLKAGVFVLVFFVASNFIILPHVKDHTLVVGIPIYSSLLLTMVWFALSRADTGFQVASAIGAVVFAISDLLIVINLFYVPLKYSQILIMSTYYAAQFGITLSATEMFINCKNRKRQ